MLPCCHNDKTKRADFSENTSNSIVFFSNVTLIFENPHLIPEEASPAKASFNSARRLSASMVHFYSDSGPRDDWDAPIAKFVKQQQKVQKLSRNPVSDLFIIILFSAK